MARLIRTVSAILTVTCATALAWAGEWPRFMGPNGTGVVEQGEKIARSWPGGKPKELWRVPVSEGFGGPAIVNGKVYIMDRKGPTQDFFRVFDLKSGEPIWEYPYPAQDRKGAYPGSRGTPTVDGDLAFAIGVAGNLSCFDTAARKVVWTKSLQRDLGGGPQPFGFAQSPMVLGDQLIVSVAGNNCGVMALDKKTGEVIWKSVAFGASDTYNSPALVKIADQEQITMWHRGVFAGLDPKDGKILWKYQWPTKRPIPQPAVLGDGRFFMTLGYGNGCALIRVEQTSAGEWKVNEIFQDDRAGSRVSPPLAYKGHIYVNSEEARRGLQCLTEAGEVKWETISRPTFGLGGMILADGVIFIVNSESGDLVMVDADPSGYKELGRAKVLGGRDIFGPLALSNGMLVLRDQSQMKCVQVGEAP